jgi:hypothetical protein
VQPDPLVTVTDDCPTPAPTETDVGCTVKVHPVACVTDTV